MLWFTWAEQERHRSPMIKRQNVKEKTFRSTLVVSYQVSFVRTSFLRPPVLTFLRNPQKPGYLCPISG